MKTILYEPQLIEQAVRLAVRNDPASERQLHRSLSALYAIADAHERDEGFHAQFAAWFSRLGLDQFVAALLGMFPTIREGVGRVVVRLAPRARGEGADLLVRAADGPIGSDHRTLMIQLRAESLVDSDACRERLLRDFQHVADMLDEGFVYRPQAISGSVARQHLVKDRYRVLWDIHVEARLVRAGRLVRDRRDKLRALFLRVFPAGCAGDGAFDRLWQRERITHAELLDWSENPQGLLEADEMTTTERTHQTRGGELCPCCGFPTHDWTDFADPEWKQAEDAARSWRPGWSPEDGLCRRCAETLVVR